MAESMAIVLPNMLTIKRDRKRDKLLQYAERGLGLVDGDVISC
jgi:NADP-dependent alcohol dehydrogenase